MRDLENQVIISVLTPTFNRADRLQLCFESLKRQTFKEFEWIIVDDGSTDNTENIVNEFKKNAFFPIYYIYKENGGKHTAVNEGYKYLNGEFMFTLDSDDTMVADCMEKAIKLWEQIPTSERALYWTVCGRCMDSITKKMVGDPFPNNINNFNLKKQVKLLYHTKGEKFSMKVTRIVKLYPFQEPDNLKFVPESTVWNIINKQYKQYYTNEFFRICTYDSENGLSRNLDSSKMLNGRFFAYCYNLNNLFKDSMYPFEYYFKTLIGVTYLGEMLNKSVMAYASDIKPLHSKIFVILLSPFGKLLKIIKKKRLEK